MSCAHLFASFILLNINWILVSVLDLFLTSSRSFIISMFSSLEMPLCLMCLRRFLKWLSKWRMRMRMRKIKQFMKSICVTDFALVYYDVFFLFFSIFYVHSENYCGHGSVVLASGRHCINAIHVKNKSVGISQKNRLIENHNTKETDRWIWRVCVCRCVWVFVCIKLNNKHTDEME